MAGSATLTAVASRPATNDPMMAAARARFLRRASGGALKPRTLRSAQEGAEQLQVLLQVAHGEEFVAHAQARGGAHALCPVRVLQQPGHQRPEAREVVRVVEQQAAA